MLQILIKEDKDGKQLDSKATFEVNGEKKEVTGTLVIADDVEINSDNVNTPDTYTDDGAEYSDDLKNALQYFYDNNVDFISCSGDITTDYRRHFRNYKLCVDTYGNGQAIYTCVGNHDTKPKDRAKEEWKGIDSINANYDIHRVDDKDGTSFYFVKELDNDKKDVYIYLNLSYGYYDELDENATEEDYSNTSYNTHYPRLLNDDELLVKTPEEIEWDDFHLYSPDTLRWLADVLEEYKDDRCFIFTHLMFNGKAGSYHGHEGYYDYFSNHADVIRGDQGIFLEDLLNKYDNNYWFSGHSHYKWLWEKYDHTINVTKSNNSWNIHIPSLSRPLPIKIYGYQNAPQDAEGAIMEVYNDYVVNEILNKFKNSYCCVFYLSDHGEEVFELRDYMGHGNAKYSPNLNYQIRIPLLVWFSSSFLSENGNLMDIMKERAHDPICSDDIGHTLLDVAGISTKDFAPSRSFVNKVFNRKRRRVVLNSIDYDDYYINHR